jgi:CO/xanthine dehydrogenase Mo-binding subunit
VTNDSLRDFKIMRLSDAPDYEVVFLETPQHDGPFGARGLGEQSVIGMPGAISNALSRAVGAELNAIPITAEKLWQALKEGQDD